MGLAKQHMNELGELGIAIGRDADIRNRRSHIHQPCYVLFLDHEDCHRSAANRPQSLQAVAGSPRTMSLDQPRG